MEIRQTDLFKNTLPLPTHTHIHTLNTEQISSPLCCHFSVKGLGVRYPSQSCCNPSVTYSDSCALN